MARSSMTNRTHRKCTRSWTGASGQEVGRYEMSIQFGRWNLDGKPVEPLYLDRVESIIAPYGPDGRGCFAQDHVAILYRAFHTTKESRREKQPHMSPSGAVITWDGRLDNHAELISELSDYLTNGSTDVAIVAMAFEKWGANCFTKF